MAMTGFICQDEYLAKCAKLSDQEVGRLFRALMNYHAKGIEPELAGRESIAFDFIKEDIDKTEKAYAAKCEKNRQNRLATNCNERKRTITNDNERPQNKNKKEKEDVVVINGDDDGPFGLTGADIHQSLLRDQQIETAARSIGLQTTEAGLMRGRRLAEQYGMDKLLDAISKAVDAPKWAYVEGILRNGGQHDGNRRNNQPNTGANNPYAFLHDDAV